MFNVCLRSPTQTKDIVEWWPMEGPLAEEKAKETTTVKKLNRCSGCKTALYCSQNCQRLDWNVSDLICIVSRSSRVIS
jgi:hypothetical protein